MGFQSCEAKTDEQEEEEQQQQQEKEEPWEAPDSLGTSKNRPYFVMNAQITYYGPNRRL